MAITGYSGFYTGLDACGRCAVGGVAANVGVGEAVPQIRTGLRLKAPAPSVPPLPVPPSSPPPAFLKHPQELEVMSSSKLWQLAQHLQTLGGGILPILPSHRKGLEAWVLKAQKLLKVAGGFRLDVAQLELPKGGKVREEFHEARKLRLQRRQATAGGTQAVRQDATTSIVVPASRAIGSHLEKAGDAMAVHRAEARLHCQRALRNGLGGNSGVLP
eukprot:s14_g10.t1